MLPAEITEGLRALGHLRARDALLLLAAIVLVLLALLAAGSSSGPWVTDLEPGSHQ